MMGVFTWIREKIRGAVIQGFADAFADLHRAEDVPALLLEHRAAEPEALPPPEDRAEAGNGRTKARK